MLATPNTAVSLARLDPISLKPVSRQVRLGEYHNAWSLSPDRSELALGISAPGRSGRVGILIVDLETMEVVRKVATIGSSRSFGPQAALGMGRFQPADVGARIRRAVWLGNGRALVFGRDLVAADGEDATVAAPATLVYATRWSSCTLDAKAGGAAFATRRVLVYGADDASSLGLRAYTIDGREAFHLLDTEQVSDVQEAGHLADVRTRRSVRVVDVRSGTVVSEIAPPAELVDVVVDPP
jgi:hypothetical protein